MGRTIPSYRIASEIEIWKWRPFRKLLDKQDRKKFDEMLSIPRLYNAVGTMACRPVLIHVILISIIFEHYKQLRKISEELYESDDIKDTTKNHMIQDLVDQLGMLVREQRATGTVRNMAIQAQLRKVFGGHNVEKRKDLYWKR